MQLSIEQVLSAEELENGSHFAPKFDSSGLLPAIVVDAVSRNVLVLAYMNEEALAKTRETKKVHFWSRSRKSLWLKGETSGHFLLVERIFVDCDQDALLIHARPAGPTCHTGESSCFYRELLPDAADVLALVKVKT